MRLSGLFLVLSLAALSLPQGAQAEGAPIKKFKKKTQRSKGTKKRVHIVAGNPSNRTRLDTHPSKKDMVINAAVQTCDPTPSIKYLTANMNHSACHKDAAKIPEGFQGNTLEVVVKYKEYDVVTDENGNKVRKYRFERNCANPKTHRFAISNKMDPRLVNASDYGGNTAIYEQARRSAERIQKAIKDCKAQNISVRGESDTLKHLGSQTLKNVHRHYNTRKLNNPQSCDSLDEFKKVNFEALAPKKDPNLKNSISFRNGGFRIGNHTYFEYDGKNKQWCRTTYQPHEIKEIQRTRKNNDLITREEVIARASKNKGCGTNGDGQQAGALRPLPLPEIRKGQVYLRGSITLDPNGTAYINPINKPLDKVDYQGMKTKAYNYGLSKGKYKSKAYMKAYVSKMRELYKKEMKDPKKMSLKDLKNYDTNKGHIAMKVNVDEAGLRESTISTYDKNNEHLRSIEMKPTNVIGSHLNKQNSWCGGENCLRLGTKKDIASSYIYQLLGIGKKNRAQLTGVDEQATCNSTARNSMEMTGGENVCMSCLGNTPGACKTDPVAADDGFPIKREAKDTLIGKYDSIEKNTLARYAEYKASKKCDRSASQELRNKVPPLLDSDQQGVMTVN